MSTAYLLAREGRSVIVIDDGAVGSGETHHTTAHLSNALDDRYTELERMHGPEGAKLAAASHTAAIDCIRRIAAHEGIDCDFELLDGYLVVPPGASTDVLKREHDAARRCGVAASLVEDVPIDSYRFGQALRFPDQGQFHPLRYVKGLAAALERLGGRVYGSTHAKARIRTTMCACRRSRTATPTNISSSAARITRPDTRTTTNSVSRGSKALSRADR
jgi:glycine/D-amino acid oxidase-like deaminating enzyme